MRTGNCLRQRGHRLVLVCEGHLRAKLRRVQEVLRHGRHDARAALRGTGESSDAVGNEEQESARLGFLRANSTAQTRAMDLERAVQARDEKMIGVRLTN